MSDAFLDSVIKNGVQTGQPLAISFPQTPIAAAPAAPAAPLATSPSSAIPPGLDPTLVTLARAIRTQESGGDYTRPGASGEYGAYQFLPGTWNATAPKFGVNVPLQQATPEQQNEVAYKQLAEWKQEHPDWNIGNFASAWNAGAGEPDAYLGTFSNGKPSVGPNHLGVQMDVPGYAKAVATYYQQLKAQGLPAQSQEGAVPAPEAPSVGGFAKNVVQSGLSLLGGVGEALLHPIQTAQNVGGAAVGGIEKAAGETTDNTAKFDSVVNFFQNRYGSLGQLEKTLYTDPVGVAADLSTVLGVGGGALKLAGAAGKIDALGAAGRTLTEASDATNPLRPIVAGASKLATAGKEAAIGAVGGAAKLAPETVDIARSGELTPAAIANTTRQAVGDEVASALNERLKSLNETSGEYGSIRDVPQEGKSFSSENLIPVSKNFFEDQLRSIAGLNVKDGEIIATGNSQIRDSASLGKLQKTLDLWKPTFQKGVITPNEYLNFRKDLADIAYNELGKKNTDVARVTDQIRHNFNEAYRGDIPGLKELDARMSTELNDFKTLKKGLFDKNNNLTDGAYSLIANAANPSNASRLARLEQIVPGITQKLKLLKAVEDMQRATTKTGTYTASILEGGTVLAGVSTGHLGVAASGFAAMIISRPEIAVKVIEAVNRIDPKLATLVIARVARYATITSTLAKAGTSPSPDQQQSPEGQSPLPPEDSGEGASQTPGSAPEGPAPVSSQSLDQLAKANNFNLTGAREAGYSDPEILAYLNGNSGT